LYTGLGLDYRLRLWAPTSTSNAISAVAELSVVVLLGYIKEFHMLKSVPCLYMYSIHLTTVEDRL